MVVVVAVVVVVVVVADNANYSERQTYLDEKKVGFSQVNTYVGVSF